jgi:hypothetical protein
MTAVMPRTRTRYWRAAILGVMALGSLAVVAALGPLAQDALYHGFADTRVVFGIPNFANVVSNLPFLAVGIVGLAWCRRQGRDDSRAGWSAFFLGVALVCIGSGYYHLAPASATLVWDRLPITVAFMSLFSALLSEHLQLRFPRILLVSTLLVGIASVMWWRYTDDLRLYVWVQGAPLLLIPVMLLLYPPKYTHRRYLLYGVGFYALAKAAEFADAPIYTLTWHTLSGHSLKHLLAALAPLFVVFMLRRREPVSANP